MAIKDYYIVSDDAGWSAHTIYWKGMTFTAGSDYDLASVKLKLYKIGSPGTITVSINATDGSGLPTGGDIDGATGTTDGDTLPASPGEWREITLSSAVSITNGVKYAIVLKSLDGDGANLLYWRYDNGNGYGGGSAVYSHNSGVDWGAQATWDFMFETHESDVSYSELSGACAGAGSGSGDLELNTYSALAGTCAGEGDGSGDLGSVFVHTSGYNTYRYLVVAGNNQIWYEDI